MDKTLVIDGNNFSDFNGFVHEFNINIFGDDRTWLGGFGQLNDLLRGGYGSPEQPFTINWINSHKSKEDLGQTATLTWLESRLSKVHPTNRERWEKQIELMKNGIGDTMFSMIVDIIVSHKDITLVLG